MEIVPALLIAVRPWPPYLSTVKSALTVLLVLDTISFLFTNPGVVSTYSLGVPILTAQPGRFLLKDIVQIEIAI